MDDMELKNIWAGYDRQMAQAELLNAQSWALNLRCFTELQQGKTRRNMRDLAAQNIFAVVVGIFYVLLLGAMVWGNRFANPFFSISVGAVAIFTAYAVAVYLRHLAIIKSINYDGSVSDTQKKLVKLRSSTIRSGRIIWLQLPFYSTFFWSESFIRSGAGFWFIALPVTLVLTAIAIWLYRNLKLENLHKRFVRALLFAGPELSNVVSSIGFLEEVEDYKKGML